MKKILISLFIIFAVCINANAATWVAKDRVPTVGKQILTKKAITAKLTFKVVDGVADNSEVTKTNVINISTDELQYAGNDNEVAAVIANELGHIICCHNDKVKLRNLVLNNNNTQKTDNTTVTVGNSLINSKLTQRDEEEADITGMNLMITAGYNPLALIVWVTKQPGSTLDVLKSRPNNYDRAMESFKYLTYAYPNKVKSGYACQEYRTFLSFAEPDIKKLTKTKGKQKKFNKEQQKRIDQLNKNLAKYKLNGGLNGWGVTYDWLTNTESNK